MKPKIRSITVSESAAYHPRIILSGAWLQQWGFTRGDKISVEQTASGELVVKLAAPAATGVHPFPAKHPLLYAPPSKVSTALTTTPSQLQPVLSASSTQPSTAA